MRTIVALSAVLFVGGCTLQDGTAPALTGPSEYALSVTLNASPDQLPRDGNSQAVVTVTVRDASSRPVAGQQLKVFVPIGTVTESSIVTGSDGRVTFGYIAPPPGTVGLGAEIQVVPVGGDGRNDTPRTLVIRFTGAPNQRAPQPVFETTPEEGKIEVNQSVRFDASKTTDENDAPCLDLCTYYWDFGDGWSTVGRVVTHTFGVAKPNTVTLIVTDAAGTSASTVKVITVRAVDPPAVVLEVVPEPPFVNQQAVFTARSTPANGHSIQRYEWDFGDATTQVTTTPTVSKTYTTVGIYVVTVTAFDDLGQAGKAAKSVNVGYTVAAPVANFTISPTGPSVGVSVTFNGSISTVGAGATIVNYVWDLGDGSSPQSTGAVPTLTASYGSAGTFVATLTITDSLGRQASKTASITVAP